MKKKILATAVLAISASLLAAPPQRSATGTARIDKDKVEKRARRMVNNAAALFETGEDERAIGMLEAVWRMYPDSAARFTASLTLARHYLEKRDFDHAQQEIKKAEKSADEEERAETMLLEGKLQLARGKPGEAVMTLRRLTQDHPTSDFSNDAFFTIGEIHFEAGRYTRAAEAFAMVGTAVPVDDLTNRVVLAEAGQRVFVHVKDKDLAVLAALGEKSFVQLGSKSGDREKAQLIPFGRGDGDFLASVETTSEPTKPGDGKLTVHGAEKIAVQYIDANTEDGRKDFPRGAGANIVSSAAISFMDGAQRQRVRGVFVDQPAFIRLRDFDLDVTDQPDETEITIKTFYRERPELPADAEPGTPPPPPAPDAPWIARDSIKIKLVETQARSGVFTGRLVTRLLPADTNKIATIKFPAGEIGVNPEEKVVAEYEDMVHLGGTNKLTRSADAFVLVGGSTEPQSIVAHSSEATVQAKKLLLEAQLLYKWATIFKDVGLESSATSKAKEGLERVGELMDLSRRFSLDRAIIEESYEVMWNLHLVMGRLKDAIATCRALVRRYPDTALADRAFMQIANARRAEKTLDSLYSSIEVYNAIIQLPNSTLKAEAQFHIGEAIEERIRLAAEQNNSRKLDFSAAMLAFKRCAETYPSSSYAGDSYKRVIDYYISTRDYTRANETLERVFEDYPDAPWLDEMLLKWGVVCHRMGRREDAITKFQRLLEEYPGGQPARQAATFLRKLQN